jgi:hypothetical protein
MWVKSMGFDGDPGNVGIMRNAGILANLSILLLFVLAAALYAYSEPLYYLSVQEDEYLEWATFWGFAAAAGLYFVHGIRQLRVGRQLPWFVFGLALFCFFVAMEEISWGQRLLGYRAPDYFLEQNYQQEFNFHNVVGTSDRKLVLKTILLGYGVILSAFSVWPAGRRVLERLRIVVPPPMLLVSFLAMFVFYSWYPLRHSGEWVELAMAFGFAYAALFERMSAAVKSAGSAIRPVIIACAAIWALAALTVPAVRYAHAADPDKVETARLEIDALTKDFGAGQVQTRCNIHKRLYTFARQYRQPYLFESAFAGLLKGGGDDARARYLLDPWNSAYWIRHKCVDGRDVKFVYSFGPDRRRNSTQWQIGGDDIGAHIEPEN